MRVRRLAGLFALSVALFVVCYLPVDAQVKQAKSAPLSKERMNQNTVSIMGGRSGSAHLAVVEDLAKVLDDGDNLRILAVSGIGPAQNVRDALFLRNMDMGITHANVLAHFKKTGELGSGLENRLVYITKLFNEEVHIISGSGVNELKDLQGKAVAFGEAGSGTDLTARLIFETLKITVTPVNMTIADALVSIKGGEVAAAVLVTGKPSTAFDRVKDGEFKLLAIPFEEALEADYLPTKLTADDYPGLVNQGESVDTIAIPAVLAAYNWPAGTDRHRRMTRFVESFFKKFGELRKEPRHPKWREVNLLAEVTGWQRSPAAKQWIETNKPPQQARPVAAAVQQRTFEQFLAAQRSQGGGGGNLPNSPAGEQALFQKFMEWMQASGQIPQPGSAPKASGPAITPVPGRDAPTGGGRLW